MNTDTHKSTILRIIILICVVITVLLRLYKLDSPLIEQYSSVQTNVLTYAKESEHNPKLFASLETRTVNEYAGNVAAYGGLIGLIHRALPTLSLEIFARILSIVCVIISLIIIIRLLYNEVGIVGALVGGMSYASLPFFVFYTRGVFSENIAMMLIMVSLWTLYVKPIKIYYVPLHTVISTLLYIFALIFSPLSIWYMPVYGYLLMKRNRSTFATSMLIIATFILVIVTFFVLFPQFYKELIINKASLPILIASLGIDSIGIRVLGVGLVTFILIGFLKTTKTVVLQVMGASAFMSLIVMAPSYRTHEYFIIFLLPIFSIGIGMGIQLLFSYTSNPWYLFKLVVLIVGIFCISWWYSALQIKDYYYHGSDLPTIANIIRSITTSTDKIATDTKGDGTALYIFNRSGTSYFTDITELQHEGYQYVFSYDIQSMQSLAKQYHVEILSFENFALLKL